LAFAVVNSEFVPYAYQIGVASGSTFVAAESHNDYDMERHTMGHDVGDPFAFVMTTLSFRCYSICVWITALLFDLLILQRRTCRKRIGVL